MSAAPPDSPQTKSSAALEASKTGGKKALVGGKKAFGESVLLPRALPRRLRCALPHSAARGLTRLHRLGMEEARSGGRVDEQDGRQMGRRRLLAGALGAVLRYPELKGAAGRHAKVRGVPQGSLRLI